MTSAKPKNAADSAENREDPHKLMFLFLEISQNQLKIKIKKRKTWFLLLHTLIVARICSQIYVIVGLSEYNSCGFWYYCFDRESDAWSLALGICYLGIEVLQVAFAALGVYRNKLFLDFHLVISFWLLVIQYMRVGFFFNIILSIMPDVINLFFLLMVTLCSRKLSKLYEANDNYSFFIDNIGSANCPCLSLSNRCVQSTNRKSS